MNTLIFLAGCGTGSFVTVLASIWLVGRVNKQGFETTKKQNELTADLMRERNELDKRKIGELQAIHCALAGRIWKS